MEIKKNQLTVIFNLKPSQKGLYEKWGSGFLVAGRAGDAQAGAEYISPPQQMWVTMPRRYLGEQQSICH